MNLILYLLIVLWGIFGILALFIPKKTKDLILKFTHSGPYWVWGIIALIMAILLWQSANSVSATLFIQVLAVLAGIKGLFTLFLPKNKIDGMLNYWTGIPDVLLRVFGVVMLVLVYYIFQMLL